MRSRLFVLISFLVIASFVCADETNKPRYSFMGYTVGESESVVVARADAEVLAAANKYNLHIRGDRAQCWQEKNARAVSGCVAWVRRDPCNNLDFSFVDGRLATIGCTFNHTEYAAMIDALKAKFGEPSTSKPWSSQNAFGATFQTTNYVWSNGASTVQTFGFYGKTTQSRVVVQDDELATEIKHRTPEHRPDI